MISIALWISEKQKPFKTKDGKSNYPCGKSEKEVPTSYIYVVPYIKFSPRKNNLNMKSKKLNFIDKMAYIHYIFVLYISCII